MKSPPSTWTTPTRHGASLLLIFISTNITRSSRDGYVVLRPCSFGEPLYLKLTRSNASNVPHLLQFSNLISLNDNPKQQPSWAACRVHPLRHPLGRKLHYRRVLYHSFNWYYLMRLSQLDWRSYLDDILDEHMRAHVTVNSWQYVAEGVEWVCGLMILEIPPQDPVRP